MLNAEVEKQLAHRTFAEQVQVLVGLQNFKKTVLSLDQYSMFHPFPELRSLHQHHPLGLQQFQAMGKCCNRGRQMFQHIKQDDGIEAAVGNFQIFNRAHRDRHSKGFLAELNHPGAHLHPRGIVSCLPQQGDKTPVRTTHLQHRGRRQAVCEQGLQPVKIAFCKIAAGPGIDIGKAKILFLVLQPVLFAIKISLVVLNEQLLISKALLRNQCAAFRTDGIILIKYRQVFSAAPTGSHQYPFSIPITTSEAFAETRTAIALVFGQKTPHHCNFANQIPFPASRTALSGMHPGNWHWQTGKGKSHLPSHRPLSA